MVNIITVSQISAVEAIKTTRGGGSMDSHQMLAFSSVSSETPMFFPPVKNMSVLHNSIIEP